MAWCYSIHYAQKVELKEALQDVYLRSWWMYAPRTMSDYSNLNREEVRHGFILCQFNVEKNGRYKAFVLDCRNWPREE